MSPSVTQAHNQPEAPRFGTTVSKPNQGQKRPLSALELGPRKKPTRANPLVHHGRHFGRAVFAFANIYTLICNGLDTSDQDYVPETQQERREQRVFEKLLKLVPGLEERLMNDEMEEEEVMSVAGLKGASSARSDDTKSLKGVVLDWIAPEGGSLVPKIPRNSKKERGFNHIRTGFLLCPVALDWSDAETRRQLKEKEIVVPGNHWPIFVYQGEKYDPEEPWKGLFRSDLLTFAYKHIFTSPSSVDDDPRATRSGNARIHGMTSVTPASIAYTATQLRFALSSAGVFCRTDKETDSETFYTSALELFEDPEEQDEVKALMVWWNRKIFPSFSNVRRSVPANSALSKIKEKRAAKLKAAATQANTSSEDIAGPASKVV